MTVHFIGAGPGAPIGYQKVITIVRSAVAGRSPRAAVGRVGSTSVTVSAATA